MKYFFQKFKSEFSTEIFTCGLLTLQPLKNLHKRDFESSSTFLPSLLMQRVGDNEKAWKILSN